MMRYILPVGLVAAALALKLLLASVFDGESPFLLFFAAVAVSAWRGGLGPGLLATALAALAADYFFLAPSYSWWSHEPGQNLRLLLFVMECVLLSALIGSLSERARGEGGAALSASEERFRSLVETLPLIVYEAESRPPYSPIYLSPKIEAFGYPLAEWHNRPDLWINSVHPDDRERVARATEEAMREGRENEYEYRIVTRDGAVRWLYDRGRFVLDADGRPARWQGVMIDITERKQTAALLEETVSLLISTLEATADGILVVDHNRRIISFNKKFIKLWRIPPEIVERGHDERALAFVLDQLRDPQEFSETVERLYAEPLATSFDVIAFKDGRIFERHSQPQMLGGVAVGRVWSFRDVTERRRAEESLRVSEERYRQMFELDLAGNLITTPDGQLLDCNAEFLGIFGFASKAQALKTPLTALHASPARRETLLAQITEHHFLRQHEMEMRRVDGTPIQIVANAIGVFDDAGALTKMHGHIFDITEQKAAEAARREAEGALQRNEQLFRTLVENAADLITIFNGDWTIRYESPAVEKMLGFRPSELRGRHLLEVVHPGDRKAMLRAMRYKIEHPGEVVKVHGRIRHKDGTYRVLEGSSVNLLQHPAVQGIVANTRDVTERVRAQAALQEKEEQLRQSQKMEAVGQLAGGIAHDFNNLLTAILGYSELLSKSFPKDAPQQRKIEEIKNAGERAAQLTRQLLAFSRRQMLQPVVLSLNTVIVDVEKLLKRLLGEQLNLQLRLEPAIGLIKADPGQLEQIILNLAINARDAMPGGGTLVIETRNVTLDENYAARHVAVRPGSYVLLAVSDTGTGIEPQIQERIFDPFFTTKEPDKGTGLGLSTVYGIVKQSGGNIWVYSEVGVGTTFKVYLPRADEELKPAATDEALASLPHGTETVLLVEDEEVVRELTREMLELLGYRVLAAQNGPDALEIANRHPGPLALLLTDVVMPRMSGRELARRLHAARPTAKTLFMSGYTEDVIVHHGVLDPDIAFLHKPFTLEALARKLREVIDHT